LITNNVHATSYEVYVDGALAATSSHTTGIPLPLDERRWRVRACLAEGCGALDSAESRMVVLAPVPSCTPLQSPLITAPGQISSVVTARIQWTFVPGANAYVVQISDDPNFSRAGTSSTTIATRELPFTFINDGNVPARATCASTRSTPHASCRGVVRSRRSRW
jgi:hypothetical protein